jgi:hypothetical protein
MNAAIMMTALDPEGEWRRGVERDGPPPEEPFGVAYWLLLQLAEGVGRLIGGERDPSGEELRATVSAYVRIIPPDVMFEAQRKLRRDQEALDADDGPKAQPAKEAEDGREQRYQPVHC